MVVCSAEIIEIYTNLSILQLNVEAVQLILYLVNELSNSSVDLIEADSTAINTQLSTETEAQWLVSCSSERVVRKNATLTNNLVTPLCLQSQSRH